MKVITNIELLKKLQPYIGESEYWLYKWEVYEQYELEMMWDNIIDFNYREKGLKTLTLEEAIELLPKTMYMYIYNLSWYSVSVGSLCKTIFDDVKFKWETLLQAIESMIFYLLENELLWKNTKT